MTTEGVNIHMGHTVGNNWAGWGAVCNCGWTDPGPYSVRHMAWIAGDRHLAEANGAKDRDDNSG